MKVLRMGWNGLAHSENFYFFVIFDPNRPLAHFSLGPPWPRPSWGPGQAIAQPGAQKVEHLSSQMQKFLYFYNFTVCFLRVGVTKYCILQGKMLTGSVTVSGNTSRPLYQHR